MSLAKDWLPSDLDRGARIAHLFRLFEELSPHVGWEVAETEDDDWQAVGLSCSPEQLAVAIRVVVAQLRKAMDDKSMVRCAQWAWSIEQLAGLLTHVTEEAARDKRSLN